MEEEINIKTSDGKTIYGTLRGGANNPLIIFVHGFTGHKDEHQFYNGARFFDKKGFSSYRFNLYDWAKDARKLEECTLSLHAKDLDKVISHFKDKGVKTIYLVGHSFGGATILLSKSKDFNKIVLWDPSVIPNEVTGDSVYLKELDLYYLKDNVYGVTFGKDMYEENKRLKPLDLIKNFQVPIKIIAAGDGELVSKEKQLYEAANDPKNFKIIPGANHTFDQGGIEEKLFEETIRWLR